LQELAEKAKKLDIARAKHRQELSNLLGVSDIYTYKGRKVKVYINRGDQLFIKLVEGNGIDRGGGFASIVLPEELEIPVESNPEGIG